MVVSAAFGQSAITAPSYPVQIISQNSGKCLDDTAYSTQQGTNMQQWSCTNASNQSWLLQQDSDGSFQISSMKSSMGLNVLGLSTKPGANVVQWPLTGQTNMEWKLVAAKTPGYYQIVVESTGDCLDVRAYGTGNGAAIQQWPCTGNTNQAWQLVADHSVALSWDASSSSGVVGYYVYRSTTTGGPYTRVSGTLSSMDYTDGAVTPGATYYYVTTATNGSAESPYSNEVQASVPN